MRKDLIAGAALVSALVWTGSAGAGEQTLKFRLVTTDLNSVEYDVANAPGHYLAAHEAVGVAVFEDGRIAYKRFVYTEDGTGDAGTSTGYSSYTFENGDALNAKLSVSWGASGFRGYLRGSLRDGRIRRGHRNRRVRDGRFAVEGCDLLRGLLHARRPRRIAHRNTGATGDGCVRTWQTAGSGLARSAKAGHRRTGDTTMTSATGAPPAPYAGRWIAMSVLLMAGFMNLIDVSIVNVALPSMQRAFGASDSQIEWVVAAYILVFALGLLPVRPARRHPRAAGACSSPASRCSPSDRRCAASRRAWAG